MSLALHAGVFAAGLAIGAVAVTASTSSFKSTSKAPVPAVLRDDEEKQSTATSRNKLQDLVPRLDTNGQLQRLNGSSAAVEVLKFGFPGQFLQDVLMYIRAAC